MQHVCFGDEVDTVGWAAKRCTCLVGCRWSMLSHIPALGCSSWLPNDYFAQKLEKLTLTQ